MATLSLKRALGLLRKCGFQNVVRENGAVIIMPRTQGLFVAAPTFLEGKRTFKLSGTGPKNFVVIGKTPLAPFSGIDAQSIPKPLRRFRGKRVFSLKSAQLAEQIVDLVQRKGERGMNNDLYLFEEHSPWLMSISHHDEFELDIVACQPAVQERKYSK